MFEGKTNALFNRETRVDFGEGGGGFFQREAEGDEGIEGFVGWTGRSGEGEFCFGGTVVSGKTDFVTEVNDDALGGFFADTGGFGDEGGVGIGDGVSDFFGSAEAKDTDSGFGANTIDRNEHLEKFFRSEAGEAVEVFGVFAEGVIGVEFEFVTEADAFGVGGRKDEFVANAVNINNDRGGEFFGDGADEVGNH